MIMAKQKTKDEYTTIQLSRETKKKLDELGKKNETYEEIIKRLLEK